MKTMRKNRKGKEEIEMKLKKVLSFLTACCTAVTTMTAGLCLSSSAAETVTFSVGDVSGTAGGTVSLPVTVDNISGDMAEAVNEGTLNLSTYQSQDAKLVESAAATIGSAFSANIAGDDSYNASTYSWLLVADAGETFSSATADETIITWEITLADSADIIALAAKNDIEGVAEG